MLTARFARASRTSARSRTSRKAIAEALHPTRGLRVVDAGAGGPALDSGRHQEGGELQHQAERAPLEARGPRTSPCSLRASKSFRHKD